jgi:hypothetical protein
MNPDEIAAEAWEYWKACRRLDWSEERNIKALVAGAASAPCHEIKELKTELEKYRKYVADLGCENPVRHPTPLDDKNYEPCGECLPCKSGASEGG